MTDTLAKPTVALENITKRFPGVLANDGVNLRFYPGEVHALLGENGAGKSTLISMLAGLQRPDEGQIIIDGQAVTMNDPAASLRLGIGTVYQHRMLVPTLTVAENMLLGAPWWQRPNRASIEEKFKATCRDFGIEIDIHAIVGDLALGQQQQVEIIRALWRGGRVLVLDEPTAMLSPDGVEELGRMMRKMCADGVSVIFVTHHLEEVVRFSDRVTVLRRGRSVGSLSPEQVRGMDREKLLASVVELMFGADAVAEEATITRPEPRPEQAVAVEVKQLSGSSVSGTESFQNVSFDVRSGEIFGIAGIDGNGQTALAQALAGQVNSSGVLTLTGREVAERGVGARYARGIRYATDDRLGEGTASNLSISLNMLLKEIGRAPFWSMGVQNDRLIDAHAQKLFEEYDVRAPGIHTPIGTLSGGNIQKVLLARELSGKAELIIYNKPTHGLDLRNIQTTRQRIVSMAQTGVATILISSDLDEILALSDRIGVMVRGEMVGIVDNHQADARRRIGSLMAGVKAA